MGNSSSNQIPMPVAGLCSLALGSLQAGQESVNNLQALSDTGCVAAEKAYECKLSAARDAGAGLAQDPGDDVYACESAGDESCEGGATCVCSSSRRRLLFATVPNKGKGEATEECSCV